MKENIWGRMLNLDRRWIFLFIGVVCIVPFFVPFGLPVIPTRHVISIFDYIEELGPENAIFVSFDFDPGTDPENMPMAVAITRHAFARHIPVFFTANGPLAQGMLESGFATAEDIDEVVDPAADRVFESDLAVDAVVAQKEVRR